MVKIQQKGVWRNLIFFLFKSFENSASSISFHTPQNSWRNLHPKMPSKHLSKNELLITGKTNWEMTRQILSLLNISTHNLCHSDHHTLYGSQQPRHQQKWWWQPSSHFLFWVATEINPCAAIGRKIPLVFASSQRLAELKKISRILYNTVLLWTKPVKKLLTSQNLT